MPIGFTQLKKMTEFDQLYKALNITEELLKEEILTVGVVQKVPLNTFSTGYFRKSEGVARE